MPRPEIVYDITRLITRFSRPVPNGIDRVDLGYASHFLAEARGGSGALIGLTGPRGVSNPAARRVVEAITDHWREEAPADHDDDYWRLVEKLGVPSSRSRIEAKRRNGGHSGWHSVARYLSGHGVFGATGLFPARDLARTAPRDAVYLNASQFPLWIDGYFRWLDRRPDVKAVFFIHDLLPITYPEFFPPAEAKRHAGRMEVASRRAAGLIVASESTKSQLIEHVRRLGRTPPPIAVVPLPVTGSFVGKDGIVTANGNALPGGRPYFVAIGTIEPRKNHLLLLNIWRELHRRLGAATPYLVLVGVRGWENENVVDMIERCPALRESVVEVGRLSTPALKQVLAGAVALLMPSLGEGYGLPVAEASASGVPVIASDLDVFRQFDGANVTRLDPLDGCGWIDEIVRRQRANLTSWRAATPKDLPKSPGWAWHFGYVETFIEEL